MSDRPTSAKLRCGICLWYVGWGIGLAILAAISGALAMLGSGDETQATGLAVLAAVCAVLATLMIIASRLRWARAEADGLRWRTLLTGAHHVAWRDVERIDAPDDRSPRLYVRLVSPSGEVAKVRAISKIPGNGVTPTTDRRYREAVDTITRAHQEWLASHR